MEKAQEILFHIDELYTENPSEEKIIRACQENPVRYQAWVDAFKDYDLSDVLQAIDEYWEFKNSKTKPNVAQIKAKLNARNTEKVREIAETTAQAAKGDYAWERMNADIEAGSCRNNLYVYRDAEQIVLNDWLAREIPASVWCKMSYASKLQQATEKGLLNNFDEALRQAAQKRFKRDYEFQSANDLENAKNHKAVDPLTSLNARRDDGLNTQGMTNNLTEAANILANHWRA